MHNLKVLPASAEGDVAIVEVLKLAARAGKRVEQEEKQGTAKLTNSETSDADEAEALSIVDAVDHLLRKAGRLGQNV